MSLSKCRGPSAVPVGMRKIQTPLQVEQWRSVLLSHPNTDLVHLVLEGISDGFRIGLDYRTKKVRQCALGNMSSALDNPMVVVVENYLQKEWLLGRVMGPLIPELARQVHTTPLGLFQRPHSRKVAVG